MKQTRMHGDASGCGLNRLLWQRRSDVRRSSRLDGFYTVIMK